MCKITCYTIRRRGDEMTKIYYYIGSRIWMVLKKEKKRFLGNNKAIILHSRTKVCSAAAAAE